MSTSCLLSNCFYQKTEVPKEFEFRYWSEFDAMTRQSFKRNPEYFFLVLWYFFVEFFLDLLNFLDFFLEFLNFLDFFCFWIFFLKFIVLFLDLCLGGGIPFTFTKVTTKHYQGYYWTHKLAKNGPKQQNKPFFLPKGQKKA